MEWSYGVRVANFGPFSKGASCALAQQEDSWFKISIKGLAMLTHSRRILMFKSSLGLLLLILPMLAEAVVFRCELSNGAIRYQDLPCDASVRQQIKLPISAIRTPKNINVKQRQKQLKRDCANFKKITNREQKKAIKQHKNSQRVSKINKEKALRRKIRCDNVKLKIQLLHNRLRAGYTARQEVRINEQLVHYDNMQKKYCN